MGAAEYELRRATCVQWDYRNWAATMSVPGDRGRVPRAVPHGLEGKRFPVRVECEDDAGRASP